MAVLYVGAKGSSWMGAEWIARNAIVFVKPALERAGLASAAERLGRDPLVPPAYADFGDLLEVPANPVLWERAVGAALAAIDAEAGAGWSEPQRFGEFRAAVAGLAELAAPDGNALVVRLADETSKKFGPRP